VKQPWATVTDVTGRGFVPDSSDFGKVRQRGKYEAHNLDEGNRFFNDNKKIYDTYGPLSKTHQSGFH
jgi:hypothetical protein